MTDRKVFIYTMITFILLTLGSYLVIGQTPHGPMNETMQVSIQGDTDNTVGAIVGDQTYSALQVEALTKEFILRQAQGAAKKPAKSVLSDYFVQSGAKLTKYDWGKLAPSCTSVN